MTRGILKVLHLLSSAGLVSPLVAYRILLATAPADSLADYAIVRRNIEAV